MFFLAGVVARRVSEYQSKRQQTQRKVRLFSWRQSCQHQSHNMASLFFRREEFGAILLDGATDQVCMLTPLLADAVEALGKGESLHEDGANREKIGKGLGLTEWRHAVAKAEEILAGQFPISRDESRDEHTYGSFPTLSFPVDLFWEITRRCNEHCLHCYNDSGPAGFHPRDDQLDAILDELTQTKLRRITISGGEPMVRRHFRSFTERARGIAHELSLNTNGTLVSAESAAFLAEHFASINISLDTSVEAEYDMFRGRRGAFRKVINGIKLLRQYNAPIVIQSVLTTKALERLEDLAALVHQLGAHTWNFRFSFRSGRQTSHQTIFPVREEILRAEARINGIKHKYEGKIPRIIGGVNYSKTYREPYTYTSNAPRLLTCAGATILAALDARGHMSPCSLFGGTDFHSESVFEVGFQRAWKESICMDQMRSTLSDDVEGCGACSNLNSECGGGCRAKAYMKKHTILTNDYDCAYSH
jgi:AdoMet-dependent heme synthase